MTSLLVPSGSAAASLAATGSDIAPWLIGAGVVIVLGALALILSQVVRSRRGVTPPPNAPAGPAAAGPAAAGSETDGPAAPDAGDQGTDPISPEDVR